jgi:hypothetical protein
MIKKGFVQWGIVLGLLSLLIRWLASPAWLEQYYSRGFFTVFRLFWDTILTSWFPMALVYVLLLVLLARFIRSIYQWSKLKGSQKRWSLLLGVLAFIGWLVFTFLSLWGFNYGRIAIEDRLGLALDQVQIADLEANIRTESLKLAQLRQAFAADDTLALSSDYFPSNTEAQLRTALEEVLAYYNYPVVGEVRARVLAPKGILLRFGSAGVYLPWTGEGHIDGGLIDLQRPSVMAHEMAHGYGFGDEGSCSFWAYLTAFRLENPVLEYAIRLGYWRSMASNWLQRDEEAYFNFRDSLATGMLADLDAINQNILAYPDIMPAFRDAAYDSYLKAQGIEEGLANYSKVVLLVEAWRKDSVGFINSSN